MPDRSQTLHLKRRGGVYWLKLAIPRPLRGKFLSATGKPRTHVEESLHTGDLTEANRRKHAKIAHWTTQFQRARSGRIDGVSVVDAAAAMREDYRRALREGDDAERDLMGTLVDNHAERIVAEAPDPDEGLQKAQRYAALATSEGATLREAMEEWLGGAAMNDATRAKYRAAVREFLGFLAADDETPERITDAMARGYVRWLNDDATTPGGRKLSQAAKQSRVQALSGLWKHLERTGGARRGSNPWTGHRLTTDKRPAKRPYTDEELLTFANGPEVRGGDATTYSKRTLVQLFALGLYTGARLGELCNRTLGDVEAIPGGYRLHIRASKTTAGARALPILHPIPVAILRERIGKRKDPKAQLFAELIPGGHEDSLAWHVQKALGRYRKRIGLPTEVDQHSARRQFATRVEALGIDPLAAERYFGHKPAGLMRGLYAKGSEERLREVAQRIAYPDPVEDALRGALGM